MGLVSADDGERRKREEEEAEVRGGRWDVGDGRFNTRKARLVST